MKKTFVAVLLCGSASMLACGGVEEVDADEFGATEEAISTRSDSTVTLRRDYRRCVAPLCGGYWVRDVNRRSAEVYVSGLDLSLAKFDEATQAAVLNAPAEELVVRGRLGATERRWNTRKLRVVEAWRGMPGMRAAAGDAFYAVGARSPQITCIAAPCDNLVAHKLATSSRRTFTRVSVEPAAKPLVDVAWLEARVTLHGALVAAHFESGQRFAGGLEKVLEASQVFVKLPQANASCPVFRLAPCPDGQTWAFTRDEDRCVLPVSCQEQRFCRLNVPTCEDGYELASWQGGGGCTAYACDPAFSVPAEK